MGFITLLLNKIVRHVKYLRKIRKYRKQASFHESELTCLSNKKPEFLKSSGPIAVFCFWNEMLRIPYLLDYYRSIGIEGFIAIDNNSTDGSREYLSEFDDVFLFSADGVFKNSKWGVHWVNQILWTYLNDRWVLLTDSDEILVYPGIEQYGIAGLIKQAEQAQDRVVYTPMIDMYPEVPLSKLNYSPGKSLLEYSAYFDSPDSYHLEVKENSYKVKGGGRERVFFNKLDSTPSLSKHSFVFWGNDCCFLGPHQVIFPGRKRPNTIAPLLHFKFLNDFHEKVMTVVNEDRHWNCSMEYKEYLKIIEKDPDFSLYTKSSVRYVDSTSINWIVKKFNNVGRS